jgi:hypothetical protein
MLNVSCSDFDPGCVKTHTSAKCRKYDSLTRCRAVSTRRARRPPEFLHSQDPSRTLGVALCCDARGAASFHAARDSPRNTPACRRANAANVVGLTPNASWVPR